MIVADRAVMIETVIAVPTCKAELKLHKEEEGLAWQQRMCRRSSHAHGPHDTRKLLGG